MLSPDELSKWKPQHIAVGVDLQSNITMVYTEFQKPFRRDSHYKSFFMFKDLYPEFLYNVKNFQRFQKSESEGILAKVTHFRACVEDNAKEIASCKQRIFLLHSVQRHEIEERSAVSLRIYIPSSEEISAAWSLRYSGVMKEL